MLLGVVAVNIWWVGGWWEVITVTFYLSIVQTYLVYGEDKHKHHARKGGIIFQDLVLVYNIVSVRVLGLHNNSS